MTTPESLLALAERVEKATAEQQREMIESAAAQLALSRLWPPRADDTELAARFYAFLNCGAYESAAMLLVPEGYGWRLWVPSAGQPNGLPLVTLWGPSRSYAPYDRDAATPALALTAASLRAHAAKSKEGNHG